MQPRFHCSPDRRSDSSPDRAPARRQPSDRGTERRRRRGLGPDDRARAAACSPRSRRSDRSGPRTSIGFGSRPRPRPSPPRFVCSRPRRRRRSSSSAASRCGSSRPASSRPRRNRSPGTKPLDSPVRWSSISARASAAMRWRWPRGPTFWPSISIRACAVGSAITPRSTTSPIGSCRSGHEPRPSRSPPVPGFISTRTAGHCRSRACSIAR